MCEVPLESSWPKYEDLMDTFPDYGLWRLLEAKNSLMLLQVLPVLFIAYACTFYYFSSNLPIKFEHAFCNILHSGARLNACYIAAMVEKGSRSELEDGRRPSSSEYGQKVNFLFD